MNSKNGSIINNPHVEPHYTVKVNDNLNTTPDNPNGTALNSENTPKSRVSEGIHMKRANVLEILFSWRSVIIILLHFSYFLNMLPVATLAMSLVCMCGPVGAHKNDTLRNTLHLFNTSTYERFYDNGITTSVQDKRYEFNWDSESQGLLISAYLFPLFVVPHLANFVRRFLGTKLTLTIFTLAMAFFSFMGPLAARTGVHFLLVLRILTGLCLNANIPIAGDMMAWWLPAQEKLTSATIVVSDLDDSITFINATGLLVYVSWVRFGLRDNFQGYWPSAANLWLTGWNVAGSLGPLLSGYFCRLQIDNGWPLIFYFNGSVTVLWTICWYVLGSRKPETHPFISEKEKLYILTHRLGMDHASSKDKTPYRAILTSRPCLAFMISTMFYLWGMVIAYTCMPLYLTSVLQFSLVDTGILLAVLSALRLPAMLLWSAFGNWLLTLKSMTVNSVRKTMMTLGAVVASSLFLAISFLDAEHKWVAVVLVVLSVASASCATILSSVVPLDMAPRYAGFISGVNSSLSCLASLTSPMIVTAITARGLYEEWRAVWIIMAAVQLTSGLIFLIFGNASLQPWAIPTTGISTTKILVEPPRNQTQEDVSEILTLRPFEE